MALEDLVKDDTDKEGHCPVCGKEGEESEWWYMRCTNSDCDVQTWTSTDYVSGIET